MRVASATSPADQPSLALLGRWRCCGRSSVLPWCARRSAASRGFAADFSSRISTAQIRASSSALSHQCKWIQGTPLLVIRCLGCFRLAAIGWRFQVPAAAGACFDTALLPTFGEIWRRSIQVDAGSRNGRRPKAWRWSLTPALMTKREILPQAVRIATPDRRRIREVQIIKNTSLASVVGLCRA